MLAARLESDVAVALPMLSGNGSKPVVSLLDVQTVPLPLGLLDESVDAMDAADVTVTLGAVKVALAPPVNGKVKPVDTALSDAD